MNVHLEAFKHDSWHLLEQYFDQKIVLNISQLSQHLLRFGVEVNTASLVAKEKQAHFSEQDLSTMRLLIPMEYVKNTIEDFVIESLPLNVLDTVNTQHALYISITVHYYLNKTLVTKQLACAPCTLHQKMQFEQASNDTVNYYYVYHSRLRIVFDELRPIFNALNLKHKDVSSMSQVQHLFLQLRVSLFDASSKTILASATTDSFNIRSRKLVKHALQNYFHSQVLQVSMMDSKQLVIQLRGEVPVHFKWMHHDYVPDQQTKVKQEQTYQIEHVEAKEGVMQVTIKLL